MDAVTRSGSSDQRMDVVDDVCGVRVRRRRVNYLCCPAHPRGRFQLSSGNDRSRSKASTKVHATASVQGGAARDGSFG